MANRELRSTRSKTTRARKSPATDESEARPAKKRISLQVVRRPKIILKHTNVTNGMQVATENMEPEGENNAQDNAPENLPLNVADKQVTTEEEPQENPINLLGKSTEVLVTREIEKQASAFDFTPAGGLNKDACPVFLYLFRAVGKGSRTRAMWKELAMERVSSMSLVDIMGKGVEAEVRAALTETIKEQISQTAYDIGVAGVAIIEYLQGPQQQ